MGDPTHDNGTFVAAETHRLVKHSALRMDRSHHPDWEVFIHKNEDTDKRTDPWPYWLTTKGTDACGLGANLQMRFWMRRKPQLYVCTALLPVTVVELIALFSFCIDYDELADRGRLLSTMMVLIFAIRFSCSSAVPNVGYMTMFDAKFVSATLFLAWVFLLQHLYILLGDSVMDNSSMDQVANVVSIISCVLLNAIYWGLGVWELYTLKEEGIAIPLKIAAAEARANACTSSSQQH